MPTQFSPQPLVSQPKVRSPFGMTIVVNPLGAVKVCNFDCVYCNLGPSNVRISRLKQEVEFPSLEAISEALGKVLSAEAQANRKIETLLLSGNGEPTLYDRLPELVGTLLSLRRSFMPQMHVAIETNGDRLDDRDVATAVNLLDERIVKVDAGSQRLFKAMNRPLSRSSLEKIIRGARGLKDVSVQTAVLSGDLSLQNETVREEWLEAVAMLSPKKVYLHAVRGPMTKEGLPATTADDLDRVAHWLERKLKFKAHVEYDSAA